jgi:hypothetical protein
MTEEPASVAGPQGLEDAAVDQTDARNAPADNLVIDRLGWIECLASGR